MKTDIVEAVVQAGAAETEYARAGSGRPTVLLLRPSSSLAAITADPLFISLSRGLRVVAPALTTERELTAWVGDLVDGLGLDRPAVVVDAAVAGAAVPLVLGEDRCSCIVVLRTAGEPARRTAASDDGAPGSGRVLELQLDAAGGLRGADLETLRAFLRCGGD